MPKIIKNGIDYTSTTGKASNISYDNKKSGFYSVNAQSAIDELNEKKFDKHGGELTGNAIIKTNIPRLDLTVNANRGGALYKNANASVDYGLVLEDYGESSTKVNITLNANAQTAKVHFRNASGGGGTYNLYGEHNITCGTADLTSGTSALATGAYYDVYS